MINIPYTLCFLTRNDHILMLKRNKSPNKGLWNGVGGHIQDGESPLACIRREIKEETGFVVEAPRFCGLLTWQGFEVPPGGLYIFSAQAPQGNPIECTEGILAWKSKDWVFSSPEVVSNIHVFGPKILHSDPPPPQIFHFQYQDGQIKHFRMDPFPSENLSRESLGNY